MENKLKIRKYVQGYRCHYYAKIGEEWHRNQNEACWAAIFSHGNYDTYKLVDGRRNVIKRGKIPEEIYINITNRTVSMKKVRKLVQLINKITPCEVLTIDGVKLIKYKFIKDKCYNSNLILLNFIRSIWYTYRRDCYNNDKFFNLLSTNRRGEDPLYFLMYIMKQSVKKAGNGYGYGDHHNVQLGIVPQVTKKFMELELHSTRDFMTGAYVEKKKNKKKGGKIKPLPF